MLKRKKLALSNPLAVLPVVATHPWGLDQLGEIPAIAKQELPQNDL